MKIFVFLFIILTNSYAFRLSRLTSNDNDSAPKAYYRWEENTVTVGTGIDPDYTNSNTSCSNISGYEEIIQKVLDRLNSIPHSSLKLVWTGANVDSDINIYSFTSAEWDSYDDTWNMDGSYVLGFASTSARCKKTTVCHFIDAVIRMNCNLLGVAETAPQKVDFESVFQHELVHAIGLDHSGNSSTIMYPSLSAGSAVKRTLTRDDESGIVFLYPNSEGPNFLKYLVCGRVNKVTKSRLVNIFIFAFIMSLIFILIKKTKYQSYQQ